ncbi:SulP family inorganic anion transporter [Clostridium cylindrosporum]|uniref:Sulfate permease n=1 Tax=Clostridium cylindrosporum DSM 605 TaxID=1121307 RepID=A0A0J8DBF7_CLOCY|nr:SulP family inorganic anion transporter [Clostridium cylindrosporum]KMT21628.1 sulfate permease [Clostridium cylindrosporum DSM 605]
MKPKLLTMFERKEITKKSITKDFISGVIVAIIALPLSVALAISSGVSPEKGLITAIIAGLFISLLGGSRVQIGGPTGAFVVIVYGIVKTHGLNGLIIATIMAGIIMIGLGLFKFGSVIKFVPYPITVGFTAGIAITLLSTQVKDFLGLDIKDVPSEFIPKWQVYFESMNSINITALLVGLIAIFIMIFWPRINRTIPGSLVALIFTTILVQVFNLQVATIGSSFESISSSIPMPTFPNIDIAQIKVLIGPAITIAILASIESLLSAVVADGMIGGKHDSNMELIAQGVGNIFSGIFGGIPATGAIARTAANIKNGGRSPISGIVHAITLLLIMLIFMPLAKLIPMTTLAAILIIVSYNMGEWRTFASLLKAPKSDTAVLLITFSLTVIFDLVVAIEVGMVLVAFLFMKSMADTTKIECVKDDKESNELNNEVIRKDENTSKDKVLIYEIHGPFFFGVVQKFLEVMKEVTPDYDVLILDLINTTAMDSTAIDALERVYQMCKNKGVKIKLINVQEQPRKVLRQMGFMELVGEESIVYHKEKNINSTL